jgi:hypothetical protein
MPKILLAPSYGNRNAKRHYHDTIDGWVHFEDERLKALLTDGELAGLRERHPEGVAHFWGARASAKRMDELLTGDIVLFTGDNKVKASGEVGFRFLNKPFADKLWREDEGEDSFVHVYSVLNVKPIERHKLDLLSLKGFSERDPLAGQRFVKDDCVPRVLRAFGISTRVVDSCAEAKLAEQLEELGRSKVMPVEKAHTKHTTRITTASVTITERVESALVLEYLNFCGPDRLRSFTTHQRLRADLYRHEGDEVEVIEAKSLPSHGKVREAVAQLLDYAPYSPEPVTHLTALFPQAPDQDGLDYLHRLGIDCMYLDEDGTFTRKPASDARREYMLPVWRNA